jgi:hypothetical protein
LTLPANTVVYSRESATTAELYRVELQEGKPQRLTHGGDPQQKFFRAFTSDEHVVYSTGPDPDAPEALMTEPISGASAPVTLAVSTGFTPSFLGVTADNRVVYDILGDLHSVAADGSGDRVLTSWSYSFHGITPEGWILYGDESALYAARGNEPAVEIVQDLTANHPGAVAVDGANVVFARTDRLVKIDVSSTPPGVTDITSGGLFRNVWLSGNRVFYQWRSDVSVPEDLYTMGLDGSSKTALADGQKTLEFFEALDSQNRVVYKAGDALRSVPLAGGASTLLLDPIRFEAITADDHVVGQTSYDDIHSSRTDGTGAKLLAVDSKLCLTTQLGRVVWYEHGDGVYAYIGSVSSDEKRQIQNFVGYPYGETSNALIIAHGSPNAEGWLRLYATSNGASAQYLPTSGPGVPEGDDRLQVVLY